MNSNKSQIHNFQCIFVEIGMSSQTQSDQLLVYLCINWNCVVCNQKQAKMHIFEKMWCFSAPLQPTFYNYVSSLVLSVYTNIAVEMKRVCLLQGCRPHIEAAVVRNGTALGASSIALIFLHLILLLCSCYVIRAMDEATPRANSTPKELGDVSV